MRRAFCGLADLQLKKLKYSNYGHPAQYLHSKDGLHKLSSQTSLLGLPIDDDEVYQESIDIDKGDKLFLFTDGITETTDKNDNEYGENMLEGLIKRKNSLSPGAFNSALLSDLNDYKYGQFKDDICIMTMGIK